MFYILMYFYSDFLVTLKVSIILSSSKVKAIFKYLLLNFKSMRFGMYNGFQSNQPNKEKLTFCICFRRFKVNFPF